MQFKFIFFLAIYFSENTFTTLYLAQRKPIESPDFHFFILIRRNLFKLFRQSGMLTQLVQSAIGGSHARGHWFESSTSHKGF